ncbi:MAG: hypothetical protein ACK5NF_05560 [Bacilli bacterium]
MKEEHEKELTLPAYRNISWRRFHKELVHQLDRDLHIKYTNVKGYSLGRLLREIENDIAATKSDEMYDYLVRKKKELVKEYDRFLREQRYISRVEELDNQMYESYDLSNLEEIEDNYSENSMP